MSITIDRNTPRHITVDPINEGGFENISYNARTGIPHDNYDDLGLDFIVKDEINDEVNDIGHEESDIGSTVMEEEGDVLMNNEFAQDQVSYEDIQREKALYLSKLNRLLKNPSVIGRRLGSNNSLDEIKGEVFRIQKDMEMDSGIQYCKQGLMFCVNTIEMFGGNGLTGWSNTVMNDANNNMYDSVLEEIYEKYNNKIAMAPEIKLISMIAGSAFMFHLQKSLVDKSMNNPGLMESLIGKFMPKASSEEKMKGPSVDTDELLRKLSSDDISDVSSVVSDEEEEKLINIPIPKKRGRKPKTK